MIKFGSWSTTLGLAAAFGAAVALGLLFRRGNRVANRFLAGLMLVVVLRMMPYVIGYAGFYDAWPWLTFAPFDLSLALGPLLFLYVTRLTTPRAPRWWLHLVPAAVQFAYYAWAFSLPMTAKNAWNDGPHVHWVEPVETVLALASLAGYLAASAVQHRRYQAWLVQHVSDRDEHRQPWLRNVLIALGLILAVIAGFQATEWWVVRLNYFDRFPLYLAFSALLLWLGLEGWRQADHRFPAMRDAPEAEPSAEPPPARDWRATGEAWAERIRREGWWREPQLTLDQTARRLATNQNYLSRALNEGLGQSFNGFINGLRVEAVQARLRQPGAGDLLGIALEEGFSSKASFNRAFRLHAGMTPSAYRAAAASPAEAQMLNMPTVSAAETTAAASPD